jgi:hypothetical protein
MSQGGFVKNESKCPHTWGNHTVPPGTIRFVPIEVIEHVRKAPTRGVKVLEDDPAVWLFAHTDHLPSNPRYTK